MTDKIITVHIGPYHAWQGYEYEMPDWVKLWKEMNDGNDEAHFLVSELTIRDWFAGQALGAMNLGIDPAENAEWAYKIADAMLEARK